MLRYCVFDSLCQMVELGCTPQQRKRVRRQRAELEKRLGYDRLPTAYKRSQQERSTRADDPDMRAFLKQARRRLRAALQKKLRPGEELPIPDFS